MSLANEWEGFHKVTEIFKEYDSGIETKNDRFVLAYSREALERVVDDLCGMAIDDVKKKYGLTDGVWTVQAARDALAGFDKRHVQTVQYRPFDFRWTFLHDKAGFLARPRRKVSQYFDADGRNNVGLCFTRTAGGDGYKNVFASDRPIDAHITSGQDYLAPLWIYKDGKREANFTDGFAVFLASLPFAPAPEDVFAYIYSVLHSPAYRAKYAEFLKSSFPAVPVTRNEDVFTRYAELGHQLIDLHLLRHVPPDGLNISMDGVSGDFELKKIERKGDALLLTTDEGSIITITGISDEVWNFEIGSHRPIERWLKYRIRDGAVLSPGQDLTHIGRIVAAVSGTIEVMNDLGDLEELWRR
jgi:predicted helicase